MNEILSETIEIRDNRFLKIYFAKNSSSKTTVFFLHGLGGRAMQWQSPMNTLKEYYNIVAPDMLGQGGSEKPNADANSLYSFQELSLDVEAIFQRFATEENFVVGHSYGGALAATLALHHSEKIKKIVLITPLALKPNHNIPKPFFLPLGILKLMRSTFEEQFIQLAFHSNTPKKLIEQEITAGRNNPMYVLKALTLGMQNIPEEDPSEITQASLVIVVNEDGLISTEDVKNFYTKIPNVQFEKIENAGHMVIVEQAQEFTNILQNFFAN